MRSHLTSLKCSDCGRLFDAHEPLGLCSCGAPVLACYDLKAARRDFPAGRGTADLAPGVWRYAALLPVDSTERPISLGEGGTPLLEAPRLGAELGLAALHVKDEGRNPTGSFKDRGMVVAVTRALGLGVSELAVPSAGNAGVSLAAYAARAGLPAHVAVPADADRTDLDRITAYGAELITVDGLLSDAGRAIRARAAEHGWFDVATFREPGRVEGKKTMAFELFEQLGELPDVIVYPTGGGTGLVAMQKAFTELERLGLIGPPRPRLVAVQPEGCAPVVRAFEAGWEELRPWEDASTVAHGLRVPHSLAGRLMLEALRTTSGTAVAVTDRELRRGARLMARTEGLSASLESGATVAATRTLVERGWIRPEETVVLFNTASA